MNGHSTPTDPSVACGIDKLFDTGTVPYTGTQSATVSAGYSQYGVSYINFQDTNGNPLGVQTHCDPPTATNPATSTFDLGTGSLNMQFDLYTDYTTL